MKRFSAKNREVAAKNMNFLFDTLDKAGVVLKPREEEAGKTEALPELERVTCRKCVSQFQDGKTICSYCRNVLVLKPVVQEAVEA